MRRKREEAKQLYDLSVQVQILCSQNVTLDICKHICIVYGNRCLCVGVYKNCTSSSAVTFALCFSFCLSANAAPTKVCYGKGNGYGQCDFQSKQTEHVCVFVCERECACVCECGMGMRVWHNEVTALVQKLST